MRPRLLYRDRDADPEAAPPVGHEALVDDLGLDVVFDAMAAGDPFLRDVARRTVLHGLTEPDAVRYRQQALADCLAQRAPVDRLYDLCVDALSSRRRALGTWATNRAPSSVLRNAVRTLRLLLDDLRKLRVITDEVGDRFRSEAFGRFFGMVREELGDRYLEELAHRVEELRFPSGVLMGARLGEGNRATYTLRPPPRRRFLPGPIEGRGATVRVDPRDDHGLRALAELREQGLDDVARAAAQSVDHVIAFFAQLRFELAFYRGCAGLVDRLAAKGEPLCVPEPLRPGERMIRARGLYDPGLALRTAERVVGNDLDATGADLIVVTGANQGGKSTFLRAVGLAHLMMQSGMPVPADAFRAATRAGILTHFTRGEDPTLVSGKLEEELARLREIVPALGPTSLLLANESFSSTSDQQGSEIARQVTHALTERGVTVVFVTHLSDFADGLARTPGSALCLRAERGPEGRRTFRIVEGAPLATGYARDSYGRIFGATVAGAGARSGGGP